MKKLLLASALALTSLTAPAAAQDIDWSITVGSDVDRTYTYDPWYGYDYRYQYQYPYNMNRPLGAFSGLANRCGFNKTPVVLNGLRSTRGTVYVSERNVPRTRNGYTLISGDRFRPQTVLCVNNNDFRNGRSATIIHDINNNRVFDRQDGIGYARLTPRQTYANRYGAMIPESVTLRYGRF